MSCEELGRLFWIQLRHERSKVLLAKPIVQWTFGEVNRLREGSQRLA